MGALISLAGLAGACSATQAAVPTTTTAAIPATTRPAASTTSTTGTTSTTLGSKPAGYDGPYPWQAQARLDGDGSPDSSWMYEAANVDAQASANPSASWSFWATASPRVGKGAAVPHGRPSGFPATRSTWAS